MATPLKAQTAYNTALDIKNLEFKSLGADFSTVSEEEAIGGSALASNPTADNGKTALSLTVNGPLNGSFRWKVSSEYLFDKLVFRIDGSEVDFISGLRRWKTKSFSLSSGEHTLEWSYEKDGNNSKHADRGWVDYLVFNHALVLHGDKDIFHEIGNAFNDPGATYYDGSGPGQSVTTSDNVSNVSVQGNYTLTYSQGGLSVTRTVTVKDMTPPLITLQGDTEQNVMMGAPLYIDPGALAFDAFDGNVNVTVTGEVDTNKQGDYVITYNATDSTGNDAQSVIRTVHVLDTLRPVITLNGSGTIIQEATKPFIDPGARAQDNGDTAVLVNIGGTVNVNQLGGYTLTYNASDPS
ncbi:MAG TPA: hypothetical protein DD687_14490, partial [Verrucomicrobiales bacterium]|nr:hypothetical protein [Verrucomicrobiales bacterium]